MSRIDRYCRGRNDAEFCSVDHRHDWRDIDYWDGVRAYEREQEEAVAKRRAEEYEREVQAQYEADMAAQYEADMAARCESEETTP